MIEWHEIVIGLASAVTAFLAAWWGFKYQMKQIKLEQKTIDIQEKGATVQENTFAKESYESLIQNYKDENERLIERDRKRDEKEALLEKMVDELKVEITRVKDRMSIMEATQKNFPIPHWVKDNNGVIVSMNRLCHAAFIAPFKIKLQDAIGLTDEDIFGAETAALIKQNDDQVRRFKKEFRSVEELEIAGVKSEWIVVRYPIWQFNQMYLGGIAYPKNEEIQSLKI